jgi:haloalkane dehalogenase
MPTGLIVARTLRRAGHDLDKVQAAYDAPFSGVESKAGARRFPWCLPFAEQEAGGAVWQEQCRQRLPTLGLPVHFVWGDADEVFSWDQAEAWSASVAGSTLDRVDGAGHFLQEDAPTACVDAVLDRAGPARRRRER